MKGGSMKQFPKFPEICKTCDSNKSDDNKPSNGKPKSKRG